MKRDMDLVRELLLKLEALPMRNGGAVTISPDDKAIAVEGYDVDQIDYHLSQIIRAGWIDEGGGSRPMALGFDALRPQAMIFWTASETLKLGRERKRQRLARAGLPSTS